ncbi:MAG TPA: DNA repair protein RecO [Candidatus Saccharimonadales bacterium]|nr:DNA repair protein RecO [Candidatus Saccharimonadales bacterium]
MKQLLTTGIILRRTDYGEADRIILLLTPEQGKLSLVAKGVRRAKSKLAGGIELFSVSHITYLPGRSGSGLGTLVSTRLIRHYGHIVQDITRTMLGYDLIKQLNKVTEDNPEPDYFELLEQTFAALDDQTVPPELIKIWFNAQLIRLGGHTPNLQTDTAGDKLAADSRYDFDYDQMAFARHADGNFGVDQIKFLRLIFSGNQPAVLSKVTGVTEVTKQVSPLVTLLSQQYIS